MSGVEISLGGRTGTAEVVSGVNALEAEWDGLAERLGEIPFVRPGWFRAFEHAFVTRPLEVLTIREDAQLVGVFPLMRTRFRTLAARNPETPCFGLLAADGWALDALARSFFALAPRTAVVGHLHPTRPEEERLREAAQAAGYRLFERAVKRSPYTVTSGSWDDYERALSRNVRGDIRRRWRRLREEGDAILDINSGAHLAEALEEGYAIEGSGWKDACGSSIRVSDDKRRFYTDVAHWAADHGWLRLCFLRLDGRPIAFHFDLVCGGVLYHLKGGFDPALAHFSPSKLLHYLMLQHAFTTGVDRYDFLGVDETYKLQLSNGVDTQRLLHLSAPRLSAQAERISYLLARRIGVGRLLARRDRRRAIRAHPSAAAEARPVDSSPEVRLV